MHTPSAIALEYPKILEMLANETTCAEAKARCLALEPCTNATLCAEAMRETGDARKMIEAEGLPPLAMMEGLEEAVRLAEMEGLLTPEQLSSIAMFASTCRRMTNYLKKCELLRVELSLNGRAFLPLEDIQLEIDEAIRGDTVADSASNTLRDTRRKIEISAEQIRTRLANMLRNHAEWFSDGYVAIRGGRQTLPVKTTCRMHVPGSVVDRSASGSTLFIEPTSVAEKQNELDLLRLQEENEVRKVLYALSAMAADAAPAIRANMKLMVRLDFAFAKARLSIKMNAREPETTMDRRITIVNGRHPLLEQTKVVPLNYDNSTKPTKDGNEQVRGVIVTGPNTGGKTVALKTIGLMCMMAQSGLHVPCGEGTVLPLVNLVLCDIGDGQSISENLSTFSAHMTRVLEILRTATQESLVLLDELGSGTDPAEGMGLAVAILDELVARGCLFTVTTHYPEIKEYARQTEGVINARMAFDPVTLSPLYTMEIGEAGESCAIHIARRLGFSESLLERAERAAYGKNRPKPEMIFNNRPKSSNDFALLGGSPKLSRYDAPKQPPQGAQKYGLGDSVKVYPEGKIGIVAGKPDEKGMLLIHMQGKKREVSYKRLKLIAKAEQMYPEDYDFSIVFDSVANRKAAHTISRKHEPTAVVILKEGSDSKTD